MSNVNIRRAVENIRSNTTIYTPIVEVIVNGIEAIEAAGRTDGIVTVIVHRLPQIELDSTESRIEAVSVHDNGIGFTEDNRNSFDTLYSDYKIERGGKGFGRFTCLKYFNDVQIESVYLDGKPRRRKFSMGTSKEIILNEIVSEANEAVIGTTVSLTGQKQDSLPRKLSTIARGLVEILLPYFITKDYQCPVISLAEADCSEEIVLNEYLGKPLAVIQEVRLPVANFVLEATSGSKEFFVRTFKIAFPRNKVSKISLVAHKREVTESSLQTYIPEFADEFVEKTVVQSEERPRNYIIKSYVFGEYLDETVSLERGAFEFHKDTDLIYGISQTQIEEKVAELTKAAVAEDVISRQEKKRARVRTYVEERAPWHKMLYMKVDISAFPANPSDAEIEGLLQREKFRQEVQIRAEVDTLLKEANASTLQAQVAAIASRISESSKNDLVHYVALRRQVLDLFKRSLELNEDGAYESEGTVHDIIFPTKSDSISTAYSDHNLWIIDERLAFTSYIASDLPLEGGRSQRPDLLVFDNRVAFRVENETSNPVAVFEFKKPNRDDFVDPSSKEDPIQQVIRYVNSIREGKYKTPLGRRINIEDNTPFFGYVVCDITPKVEKWLRTEKDFKPMPDKLGWFSWIDNINLYVEVLSWDKLLRDAEVRNRVFFHKLGL